MLMLMLLPATYVGAKLPHWFAHNLWRLGREHKAAILYFSLATEWATQHLLVWCQGPRCHTATWHLEPGWRVRADINGCMRKCST